MTAPGPDAHALTDLDAELRADAGTLPARAEIVIVGAGIMGLSIAYHLAKRGLTDVVVLDRGYLAEGASGRNGGGIRQQWSTELNIRLMRESVELCRRFATELGVNVWFRQGGYLFLARTAKELARLERNIALQNKLGVPTQMIDPARAGDIVPQLALDGIIGAAYNATDGIMFPWPFLWGYAKGARARGVTIATHTPVTAIAAVIDGYQVHTRRGTVHARRVINCTGAWSPAIGRMVGVDIPTWPIRHEICSSEPLKPFLGPMVSELSSGLYFSQSMRGEIVGGITVPSHGRDASPDDSMGSSLEFITTYARRLSRMMPILRDIKILRAWAGPYDGSPDGNPIVGAAPGQPNFFLACGFVGHGFMMAPIVGKRYADWLAGDAPHEFFARYTLARFSGGPAPSEKEDFNIG